MPPTHQRYGALLDTIYAAAADPSQWPEALTRTSDYLGAVGGALIYHAPPPGRGMMVLGRMSEELAALYWKHYAPDPWATAMKTFALDRPIATSRLVEMRLIRRTGFYADILLPSGIEDMLGASIRPLAAEGGVGGFSFGLSGRAVEQTDERLRRFGRLLPHLSRALDASLQLGRHADGARQLARVLEGMQNAALLLDGGGRVTYANASAETLLAANDGLAVTRGGDLRLTAALPAEAAAMRRALGEALSVANGEDGALGAPLRLTRPSGRAPLLIIPVPLPPPAFAIWELVEAARAMVIVIDPEAGSLPAKSVQAAFGLTAAEARVAALVGGGLSGPESAAALGISPETVKTHLARCFAKTGVHSQAELARLLATLPRPTTF